MSLAKQIKKNKLLLVVLLLLSTSLLAQFPEGFESGTIPSTWTTYDQDGNGRTFIPYNAGGDAYDGSWVAREGYDTSRPNDDWLVTPQINVTNDHKVVKFYARGTSTSYTENFNIKLSTTGNAVANFTVNVASHTGLGNQWYEYIVDLTQYIGDSVYLAVQYVSYNQWYFHVDGFDWVLNDDMAAVSVTGSNTPTANTEYDYIVNIKNNGSNSQSNYTVKFYVNDEEVATQNGTAIAPGVTVPFAFPWTPTVVEPHTLHGEVIMTGDMNDENDQTPPFTVYVQPEGTATINIGDPNTSTSSYQYPINFFYKGSLTQCLYMADEIEVGGAITSIKYYFNSNGDVPMNSPIKIWMANTANTSFSSATSWIPFSDFQLVYDGGVDLTAGGPIELSIPLQTPFAYGGDNLAIMIKRPLDGSYYSSSNTFKYTTTANYPNRTLYYYSDSVDSDPAAPPSGRER